ncbi:hypothetical protein [Burkholderia gladioli]|uniref:hypothetical protein n=1 Tax=Burkholderia gladioli TaxID=28095 RepID=UPI0020306ACA|nr:hypothetical protein [Burkholderia gladioli]URV28633.1 hypothetical protein NAL90_20775 [Burkholderia gladioli]
MPALPASLKAPTNAHGITRAAYAARVMGKLGKNSGKEKRREETTEKRGRKRLADD